MLQCYPVLSGESGRARGGRRLLDFMRRDTTGGGGGGGGKDRGQMVGADGGGGGGKKQAEAGPVKTGRVRARTVWPAPLTRLSKASRRWRWRRETNRGGAWRPVGCMHEHGTHGREECEGKVRIYITLCSSGESPPPMHLHWFAGQLIFCRLLLPDRTADQSKEEIEQVFPDAEPRQLICSSSSTTC